MKNVTDVELIQRTLDGETDVFGELIKRYQDAVYATALHRAGNFTDAQDIAQEAFVKAYSKLQTLREPNRFPSWLHTITLRECNRWRRKQRESIPIEELSDAQILNISNGGGEGLNGVEESRVSPNVISHISPYQNGLGNCSPPDAELERKEFRQLVLRAIASLPEKVGEAVTLYYINGLSYDEIAGFLSVSASTVKGRLQTGRKQLKEEFITMFEETLKQNRPDEKFTAKVLNEIIESAKQAREREAHDEVVQLCEKALETLKHLEATKEHKRTEMDVLDWRGDEWLKWFGKPKDAAENFQRAFHVAKELGDKEAQAKWMLMQAISFSRAGNYQAMIRPVQQARTIYAELGQTQREVICVAILDLIALLPADWERVVVPSELNTGYAIHRYRLVRSAKSLTFIEEERPEPEMWCERFVPNLMSIGWALPRSDALIAFAGQPETILTFPIEVGSCWQGMLEIKDVETLPVARTIEADDDTIVVPAGKFEDCLRVETVISEPDGVDFSDNFKTFLRRRLCGVRTIWFAPDVGLIKYRHENDDGGIHTVQLLEFHVGPETNGDYFPLSIGNRWKYERYTDWCNSRKVEAYHVVAQVSRNEDSDDSRKDENFHLACAAYSEAMDDAAQRSFFQTWLEQEKASSDQRGQVWMLLKLANLYARLSEKEAAMTAYRQLDELTAQLGDAKLQFEILLSTEWKNPLEFVSERYEHALRIANEIGDLERQKRCLGMMADYYLRRNQYTKALECAQDALAIAEEFGDVELVVGIEAEIDLASALIDELKADKVIKGEIRSPVPAKISESEIVFPETGGIASVTLDRRPIPSLYGLGFYSDAPLLKLPATEGEMWSNSYGDGTVERFVEAIDEIVSVPAGEFNHCVKVKTTVQMRATNEGSPQADENYNLRKEYREGDKWMWFAKGIGVVKVEHHHPNGKQTTIELTDYHLVELSDTYFPISIGNRWRYEWRDENGELLFKEQERVILEHEGVFQLACSGYTTAEEYADKE